MSRILLTQAARHFTPWHIYNVRQKMNVHGQFYTTLAKISDKHAEDIARGIERGHDRETEAKCALLLLADVQKTIRELERVEFEFDVDERINVPEDLKWMRVSAAALVELVAARSAREDDIIKGFIFHDALFRKVREIQDWAKQYKDA